MVVMMILKACCRTQLSHSSPHLLQNHVWLVQKMDSHKQKFIVGWYLLRLLFPPRPKMYFLSIRHISKSQWGGFWRQSDTTQRQQETPSQTLLLNEVSVSSGSFVLPSSTKRDASISNCDRHCSHTSMRGQPREKRVWPHSKHIVGGCRQIKVQKVISHYMKIIFSLLIKYFLYSFQVL